MRLFTPPPFAALLVALFLAFGASARAQSTGAAVTVTLTSEAGEPIGQGRSYLLDQTTGHFDVTSSLNGSVYIRYYVPGVFEDWSFYFSGPHQGPLAVGSYAATTSYAGPASEQPALSVWSPYLFSSELTGSFEIKKIIYGPNRTMTAFWATFAVHHQGNAAALRGEIKFNIDSTAASVNQPPVVYAGEDQRIATGQTAALSGAVVDDQPGSSALGSTWTKVSGPGEVAFADATALQTTASFSAAGSYVLRLLGMDGEFDIYDEVTVTVVDLAKSATIHLEGDAGAPITGGATFDLDEVDGAITVDSTTGSGVVWVSFAGNPGFHFRFSAAEGMPLTAGVYADAIVDTVSEPGRPALYATGLPLAVWSRTASFEIKKLAYGADGQITAFWATLEESVDGATARGEIRFHADSTDAGINQAPGVIAGADTHALLPDALALAGQAVDDGQPAGTLATTWSLVSGTGVATFADPHALATSVRFSKPGDYVLRLTADDGEAAVTSEMRVSVIDPAETWLEVLTEADAYSSASTQRWTPADGVFHLDATEQSVNIYFTGSDGSDWSLTLDAGEGKKLGVGSYVARPDSLGTKNPYFDFSFDPVAYLYSARFEILKLIRAPDGSITSLWVEFRQKDYLRGELRYNAGARGPDTHTAPGVAAGFDALVAVNTPLPLAGKVADEALPGARLTTTWSMASGPTPALFSNANALRTSVTFSKAGDYVLKLTASDGALSRASTLLVSVTGPNDPTRVRLVRYGSEFYSFDQANSTIDVHHDFLNAIEVAVNTRDGAHWFDFSFAGPEGKRLTPGEYGRATRYPFQPSGANGIDVSGDGAGENQEDGRFTVKQIEYTPEGRVAKCWITFTVFGADHDTDTVGEIRYHADAPDDPAPLRAVAGTIGAVNYKRGATLHGAALRGTAPAQDPLHVRWSDQYGDVVFDDPHSLTTKISFYYPGVYQLTLTVWTGTEWSASNTLVVATEGSPALRDFYLGGVIDTTGDLVGTAEVRTLADDLYAARLHLAGKTYAFSGRLGWPEFTIPGTSQVGSFSFNDYGELQLAVNDGATQYTGVLHDSGSGVVGDFPASSVGSYTIVATHFYGEDAAQVLGAAWGALTVTPKGFAIAKLNLPDGQTVVTTSRLTPDGETFVNGNSPDRKSVVAGALALRHDESGWHVDGDLLWTRRGRSLVTPGALAFTTRLSVDGLAKRQVPANKEPLLLSQPALAANVYLSRLGERRLNVPVNVFPRTVTPRGAGDTQVQMTFDDFGQFTGSFIDPSTNETIGFQGAVLPGEGVGYGYFYAAGKSGLVEIRRRLPEGG
jgi:hypothetical protein